VNSSDTGQNGVASVNVSADSEGTANLTATLNGEDATEQITVADTAANFAVSNVSPDGANVTQGDLIDVTAEINNTGDANGTQTVEFRLDTSGNDELEAGEELANQSVSLDAGENTTVTFEDIDTSVLPNQTVTYTHGVVSEDDQATASINITVEEDGGAAPGDVPAELDATAVNAVVSEAGVDDYTQLDTLATLDAYATFLETGEVGGTQLDDSLGILDLYAYQLENPDEFGN
jgi:hypothetical protein